MTDPAAAATPPGADDPANWNDADPVSAARLGMVPASAGFRSLAFAIDFSIWALLASPVVLGGMMAVSGDTSLLPVLLMVGGWALASVFGLIQLITHGRRGVTVGKAALRLRSIGVSDYGRPGFWRVVLRILVLWASTILLVVVGPALLFASAWWDPQRRGRSILDRTGRCWVIDARAGLDPFDAKALRHARRVLRGRPDDAEALPSMASGADAESALRIPDARSRAGVVGPGGTGAQWARSHSAQDLGVIDGVPGASPSPASPAPTSGFAPSEAGFATVSAAFAPPAVAPSAAPPAAPPAAAPRVAPLPAPAAPPAEVVQAAGSAPAAGLRRAQAMVRFDDGSVLRVPVLALIGRDPDAAAGETADALVRLEDPQRLMSKTHAAFGQDAEGVWVSDRGSRNGTQLLSPGGDLVDVPVGDRMRVPLGWTVQVGGRTFELVPRGADS
ncbi:RDD family protein [Microbacterium sp. CFBP9034]|uniref:RDD family protein n=1 Tax=Microbacterium sp. CFBP9034 TaxID=3096540 RepID=UPI002A69B775|nr:RDD family protein [Microbacterium sp. CFBP9034]MDY0910320.1 RDD family protein [Microbacterium sp. CFBP9034]